MTDQIGESEPDSGDIGAEVEFISAERLIFFSDAVAAIAMTLLAFTLKVPGGASNGAILHNLWQDQYRLSYLEFLISFMVIGRHWRSHHSLFRDVTRLDSRIITLNMVWLLMIVIIPFTTKLLSSGAGGFGVRFSFYAIVQVLTVLTFLLMGRHLRGSELLRAGAPRGSRDDDAALLTVAAMFAISIPVAFVTQWAFVFWVASVPAARAVRRCLAAIASKTAPAESGGSEDPIDADAGADAS
jgi:uncharacterized membrane protein